MNLERCYTLYFNDYLTAFMKAISFFGNTGWFPVFLVILTFGIFNIVLNEKKYSYIILLTPLAGEVIKSFLKNSFQVLRPQQIGCKTLILETGFSFPSGHVIFYTIFFGLLINYSLYRKELIWRIIKYFSTLLIVLVPFSRIYLGAHWIGDVFFGYLIGFMLLFLAIKFWRKSK